jgi:hypothetical protein
LIFRGDRFDLKIPLQQVSEVEAKRGQLRVAFSGGSAVFELGPQAEKWALKIRYPKNVIDKPGVKPDSKVAVLGVDDDSFLALLRARTPNVTIGRVRQDLDFILYGADSRPQLAKLKRLKMSLKPGGAIWVVSLKGKAARIKDVDVIAAAKAAGLVDVKVVGFSETHTSLKLVIPVDQR